MADVTYQLPQQRSAEPHKLNRNFRDLRDSINQLVDGTTPFTGQITLADGGTAAAPAVTFTDDADTGIYRAATNVGAASAGGAEIFRWGSRGIAVGSTDTTNYRLRLDLEVDGATVQRINHTGENTTTSKVGLGIYLGANNGNSAGANDYYAIFRKGDGTTVGSINGTGASGVNYNTTSDQRLKTSIAVNPDVGDIVDALRIHQFSWDETGVVEYGVFAQEAHQVYAPPIKPGESEDELWQADYGRYVGLALAELKSLRGRVAALETA